MTTFAMEEFCKALTPEVRSQYGMACRDFAGWQNIWLWVVGLAFWFGVPLLFFLLIWKLQSAQDRRRRGWGSALFYQSRQYKAEFSRNRTVVLRQHGHCCAQCGSTDQVEVHHIQPRAKGGSNDPSNLVPLCHTHHQIAHGRRF